MGLYNGYRQFIPSAVSDEEAQMLQELALNKRVLEMGAHYGFSTVILAEAAKAVVSVDWHKGDAQAGDGDNEATLRANLQRFGAELIVEVISGRFEDVLPTLPARSFDGVFIDGAHDYASVDRDTMLAQRVVKKGGFIAWHDYGRFEVARAVDEFCALLQLSPNLVDTLAWIEKP